VLVLLGVALPAAAQYPNRAVTLLTGYPAGGLVDIGRGAAGRPLARVQAAHPDPQAHRDDEKVT